MNLTFVETQELRFLAFLDDHLIYDHLVYDQDNDYLEMHMLRLILENERVTDVFMTDYSCINREFIHSLGWGELYDHVTGDDQSPVIRYPRDVAKLLLSTIISNWNIMIDIEVILLAPLPVRSPHVR